MTSSHMYGTKCVRPTTKVLTLKIDLMKDPFIFTSILSLKFEAFREWT